MRAFNLAEALAGKPVVNSNGDKVFITVLNKIRPSGVKLISQNEGGSILSYHFSDGRPESGSSLFQLFMAPTTVTKWVNIYPQNGLYGLGKLATHYDSESEADHHGNANTRLGGKAHKITYEE